MNWLFIVTLTVLLLFGAIGFFRGLIRSVLGICATILALVLSYALSPVVSNLIRKGTGFDEYIEKKVYSLVENKVEETTGGTEKQVKKAMEKNPKKSEQIELINGLNLPHFLTQDLLDGNNLEKYKELGVSTVYGYIAKTASNMAVNILAGIIVFITLRLLFIIVTVLVGRMLKAFPIIAAVDKTVGAVCGVLIGICLVWLLMFILSLAMKPDAYQHLLSGNSGLQWLSDKNMIRTVLLGR